MRKLLFLIISLIQYNGFSQLIITKLDGSPIQDGAVFNFNTLTSPSADLSFKLINTSISNIAVKLKCMNIINSNGSNLQFCVQPICISALVVGAVYPDQGIVIPAYGNNGNFDHFINMNSGITVGSDVEYIFKFFMINSLGTEIGNSYTITYDTALI